MRVPLAWLWQPRMKWATITVEGSESSGRSVRYTGPRCTLFSLQDGPASSTHHLPCQTQGPEPVDYLIYIFRLNEEGGPPLWWGVLPPSNTAASTPHGVSWLVSPHSPGFPLISVAVASELPSLALFPLPLASSLYMWTFLGAQVGLLTPTALETLLTPRPVCSPAFTSELQTLSLSLS